MWFLILLGVIAVVIVRTIISADKESFYNEKKGQVLDLVDLLVEGLSLEEIKDVIAKCKGVSEPSLKSIEDSNELYVSGFDWGSGYRQYKGEIKIYLKNGKLVNREICLL